MISGSSASSPDDRVDPSLDDVPEANDSASNDPASNDQTSNDQTSSDHASADPNGAGGLLALVAFPSEGVWSLEELAATLRDGMPGGVDVTVDAARNQVTVSAAGQTEVTVSPERTPIPREIIEGPCTDAAHWPGAMTTFATHRSHLICVERSTGAPLHRALFLTRVAAVLGEALGYIGVYWDGATMVHSAKAFSESAQAMKPKNLPLRLWVNFRPFEDDDGTHSLFTTGLDALGEREIEVWGSRSPMETLVNWAFNTAHYLVLGAGKIEHGQAVGVSQTEFVHAFLRPSMFPERGEVYCLVLEE